MPDSDGGWITSIDPARGTVAGAVPATAAGDVESVVSEVAAAQEHWARRPVAERAALIGGVVDQIIGSFDEIAKLVAREQGKPVSEACAMEVTSAIDASHWVGRNAERILKDAKLRTSQPTLLHKRHRIRYEPLGVVAVIAPSNYPWAIPFTEVAIALACGNGVVLKPSELTPLTGERLVQAFVRAGVPPGLVRAVQGGPEVGDALVRSSAAKVFFTGTESAGRRVAEACGEQLKGCVLELSGKDAMIVLDDARLPYAIDGCLWAGFANAGQSCSGVERVYVLDEVAGPFVEGLVAGARRLRVGDPLDWSTDVGPLLTREQAEHAVALIDDAVEQGATLRCGGPVEVPGLDGDFFAPAVVTGVDHGMRIMREEVFGPVVSVMTVGSESEAVELANDSPFGLGASVWTRDRARADRLAALLETGMVWTNDHMYTHGLCQCSWGGVKQSGLGRTHSELGFRECVTPKLVAWDPSIVPDFWWYPYEESVPRAVRAAAGVLYGRRGRRFGGVREGAVPLARVGWRLLRGAVRR